MMQSEYMNEGGCVFQKFGTWGNWRMYVYIFYSVMHNNGNSMNSNSYAHTHTHAHRHIPISNQCLLVVVFTRPKL